MNREGVLAAVRHYFGGRWWPLLVVSPLLALVATIYVGVGIQLCRWLRQRQWRLILLFLALAEYYLLLPGPITMPRYQLPALPMLCAMAAMAIAWMVPVGRESQDAGKTIT